MWEFDVYGVAVPTSSLDLGWLNPTTCAEAEIKAMAANCPVKDWEPNVPSASELLELLRLAHGLGPAFVYGLVKDYWSLDGHMLSITANIMLGDLVDSVSTLIGGMPGTGKTRCVALVYSILVAGVGKRKVLFASLQNEPVRSMMISVEERLVKRPLASRGNSLEYPG